MTRIRPSGRNLRVLHMANSLNPEMICAAPESDNFLLVAQTYAARSQPIQGCSATPSISIVIYSLVIDQTCSVCLGLESWLRHESSLASECSLPWRCRVKNFSIMGASNSKSIKNAAFFLHGFSPLFFNAYSSLHILLWARLVLLICWLIFLQFGSSHSNNLRADTSLFSMSTLFFSPSCPSGGNFYACDVGANFVGCCKDDPCDDNGCSAGNLEPASFDSSQYGKFADQECPSDSKWYTCKYTHPPFMGCCKSSPCGTGCNATDLTAGYLSSNPTLRAQFLPSSTSSAYASHSSGSNSESATSPMSATASETGSEPQTAAATTSPIPHKTNTGAIAGGITGGGIFLVILVGLLLLYCYKGAAAFRLSRKSYGMSSLENPPATTAKGEAFGSFPDESEHTHYQGTLILCI